MDIFAIKITKNFRNFTEGEVYYTKRSNIIKLVQDGKEEYFQSLGVQEVFA